MKNRADSDLQRQVESELFACPDVDETDITVKVTDGTVTLTGYARSFADKSGAEDAVRRVRGVTAVANAIQVRSIFRPRAEAAREVSSDPDGARRGSVLASLTRE